MYSVIELKRYAIFAGYHFTSALRLCSGELEHRERRLTRGNEEGKKTVSYLYSQEEAYLTVQPLAKPTIRSAADKM